MTQQKNKMNDEKWMIKLVHLKHGGYVKKCVSQVWCKGMRLKQSSYDII